MSHPPTAVCAGCNGQGCPTCWPETAEREPAERLSAWCSGCHVLMLRHGDGTWTHLQRTACTMPMTSNPRPLGRVAWAARNLRGVA